MRVGFFTEFFIFIYFPKQTILYMEYIRYICFHLPVGEAIHIPNSICRKISERPAAEAPSLALVGVLEERRPRHRRV